MRLRKRDTLNLHKNNDNLKKNVTQVTKVTKNNACSKRIKRNALSNIQSTKTSTNNPKTAAKNFHTHDDCGNSLQQSSLNENAVGAKVANKKSLNKALQPIVTLVNAASNKDVRTTNSTTEFSDLLTPKFSHENLRKTTRNKMARKKSLNSLLQPLVVSEKTASNDKKVEKHLDTKASISEANVLNKDIVSTKEKVTPIETRSNAWQPHVLLLKEPLIEKKTTDNSDVLLKSSATG